MGLISKTVIIKWNSRNKKYYEELGYNFTHYGDEFIVKIKDLTINSKIKVKCLCDSCKKELNITYQNYNRTKKENGKTYCINCARKKFSGRNIQKTKLQKSKSFYDWCIENNRQDVLDRWDYELNSCSPKDISYGSHKKYWFKCNKNKEHKSELKNINNFTSGHEGSKDCSQCNSVAQYILDNFLDKDLYDVWDKEKNRDLDPWNITKGSKIKIWIKCQEKEYHESYEIKCNNFINGYRCQYCSCRNGKVHPLDSLGQYIIDNYGEEFLWKVWSNKNEISPFKIAPNSNKKYWWNCIDKKHGEYKRECFSSIICEYKCPKCTKEREDSIVEEKTRLYLEDLGYKVLTEHSCTIRPVNPKTKQPLPFDNEIILENGKHLIIEVHGEQHYKLYSINSKWLKKGQTPEDFLHQRKLYDRYKRIKCVQAGYYYLELPYTSFNKQETYKKLIDNKIKGILGKK